MDTALTSPAPPTMEEEEKMNAHESFCSSKGSANKPYQLAHFLAFFAAAAEGALVLDFAA